MENKKGKKMQVDIVNLYKNGGFQAIDDLGIKLKYGEGRTLKPEERVLWTRYLRWRWRRANPDKVKAENKHWGEFYKKMRPYRCICKRCGCEFNADRPYRLYCGKCPSKSKLNQERIAAKKKQREQLKNAVVMLYCTGKMTQQEIADRLGIYQKYVSLFIKEKTKELTGKK